MRALALLALLALPARAEQALVWMPPDNYRRWSEIDGLLRERPDLKLTIGIAPAMTTPLVKAALGPWIDKGRVELAARVDGDPVFAAIASHPAAARPQDALERAADAMERLEKRLGRRPTGLLPGGGALDAQTGPALGAAGAQWILIGPYALPDQPWAAAGPSVLVPSGAAKIFDESSSTFSTFTADFASFEKPAGGWALAGDLAKAKKDAPADASAAAAWPAWDPAAAAAPAEGPAKEAWDAYGAAAAAVERFQNSGTADLRTLESAVAQLRRAQAARYFRPAAEVSAELKTALVGVYKRLRLPAPENLYGGTAPADGKTSGPADGPTGVKALSGPGWIEFRAPQGAIALSPSVGASTASAVVDGGAAADPWRIRALRADWDDNAVSLTLKVARASNSTPRPVYEIYIDVNRVLGAGRVPMLEGRGAVVFARDAWELALSIAGSEARLYRARGGGDPEETAAYEAKWASDRGEVRVVIPRAAMRGNPARWGWAAVALAEDPARPNRRPAASLVGPDGTILLGVLVPADVQKAILSRQNPRVPAARLEP